MFLSPSIRNLQRGGGLFDHLSILSGSGPVNFYFFVHNLFQLESSAVLIGEIYSYNKSPINTQEYLFFNVSQYLNGHGIIHQTFHSCTIVHHKRCLGKKDWSSLVVTRSLLFHARIPDAIGVM